MTTLLEFDDFDRLDGASDAYRACFQDCPTIYGLPAEKELEAALLLEEAVEEGQPFADDAAFFAALGLETLPAGSLI